MNARILLIAAGLFATSAIAAEPPADPTLGGLLAELRCTTRLDTYGYTLDGQSHTWLNRSHDGGATRIHTVKLRDRTICTGADCSAAREFLVGQVTDRPSYKELHLKLDETEYVIAIIGDASQPGADISLEIKARPQAKGQSVRSGACEAI
jgi:hypothetical protein